MFSTFVGVVGWKCLVLVAEYYKVSLRALICIAAKLLSSKSSAAFTAKSIFELWRRRAGDIEIASGILKEATLSKNDVELKIFPER